MRPVFVSARSLTYANSLTNQATRKQLLLRSKRAVLNQSYLEKDGKMDGRTDAWTNGWTNRRMDVELNLPEGIHIQI